MILSAGMIAALALHADEEAQRRLGDAAFYAGEYRNAISSYTSAMALADRKNDADSWAASALNLGIACLHNGDLAGARKVYEEFRRRFPLRSAGTLPGDLLVAEGKYDQAEEFFRSLLQSNPESVDATNFSLGTMYMKTGKYSTAYRIFSELAQKSNSSWRSSALNESIYALIRLGRYPDAVATIGSIPAEKRNADVELLLYLAESSSGKIVNLKNNFRKFLDKMPPTPHLRLMELLSKAAEAADRSGDSQFAADALKEALAFAADPAVKPRLHRQLITFLLRAAPEKVLKEVQNYLQLYPAASDRCDVMLHAAGKLHEKKLYVPALELYSAVIAGDFPAEKKISAALGAVMTAEEVKDFAALKKFNSFIFSNLLPEKQLKWRLRYAAFLEKNGKSANALEELQNTYIAMKKAGELSGAERAAFELLNFYIRQRNDDGIRQQTAILAASANAGFAAAAMMENGKLLEKETKYEAADKEFRKVMTSGYAPLLPEASFMAALMAYKSFDYPAAAAGFADCASRYPDFSRAPEALFMAADIYSSINDTAKADQAADLLQQKYPGSQALAALVLRNASERGYSGDYTGAIRELEGLEKNFRDAPVSGEARMLRAIFLDKAGKTEEALKLFTSLLNSGNNQLRAESGLRIGDILFRQEKLTEAKNVFLTAAAAAPGSLISDIAAGRAGDCDLSGKVLPPTEVLLNCANAFDQLARETAFPQIRLQAYCKAGIASGHAGKNSAALEYYEKAIYTAGDMINRGMVPEPQWCIRSCEAALHLLSSAGGPGTLQRGLRLIERTGELMLPEPGFADRMRENFRKQLKQRR